MSEQLKYLVAELNKEPYNKNYNLINFDQLTGEQLLQNLSDVLAEIDPKNKVDIREEEPEVTALRILGMLRILKYKPPVEIAENFREGLVQGQKQVIYPTLEWLLQRVPALKKRAYLAKYLVRVEVPPEVAADPEVAELTEQYQELIDQFKAIHKESEAVKNSGYSTVELRKDIEEMEKEKEIVSKRIDRMQRKLEGTPNVDLLLTTATKLRQERERQKELQNQKTEQRTAIHHADQRLARLERNLADLRQSGVGATPETLLQKIEEETNVNTYIVKSKLPKELESRRKAVASLQKVTNQPALGQDDLKNLQSKIKAVNEEIGELTEKRNVTNDPMEDKLTLFRQQAAIIARKKDSKAEELNDIRNDYTTLEEEVKEKRNLVSSFSGERILRGEDFKRYVNELRTKSTLYKKKRSELSDLRVEFGILSRTNEILAARDESIRQTLSSMEAAHGVSGFRDTQVNLEKVASEKAELDQRKGQTLEDMSSMITLLTSKIGERKARLAPIIKELRPLRQHCQDLSVDYDERKHGYDTLSLQLESSMSRLEQSVKVIQEEILQNEAKLHLIQQKQILAELQLNRAQEEIKLYVSNKPEDKQRSKREQLLKNISNQEKRGKLLKEQQKKVKENLGTSAKQVKLWTDLEKIFKIKKLCLERALNAQEDIVHRESGAETLVL